jgi:hypothetical protein
MGLGGQRHALATLPPGKTRYPLCGKLGEPGREISHLPGFDPRTAQPVASRFTDWAVPAQVTTALKFIYFLIKGIMLR